MRKRSCLFAFCPAGNFHVSRTGFRHVPNVIFPGMAISCVAYIFSMFFHEIDDFFPLLMSRFDRWNVLHAEMELERFKIEVLPLRPKLLRYARRLTGSEEDGEDVVQEVLLRMWNHRQELEQYRSIEAFAMTLTHNASMDLYRRTHDSQTLDGLQIDAGSHNPEQLLEINDQVRLVREIIGSLPPLQQTIMRMKDVEGYESEEIAQITGCSPESVRANLSRARKRVRDVYLQTVRERNRRTEK